MITDERMKHMLGVARQCYSLAKEQGCTEAVSRDFFLMGLLHDIGYEFTDEQEKHAQIGYEMLEHVIGSSPYSYINIIESIGRHGDSTYKLENTPLRLAILNRADMTTDNAGNPCTVDEKLREIAEHHGINSFEYKRAMELVQNQKIYLS